MLVRGQLVTFWFGLLVLFSHAGKDEFTAVVKFDLAMLLESDTWGDAENRAVERLTHHVPRPQLAPLVRDLALSSTLSHPNTPMTKPEWNFFVVAEQLDPSNFEITKDFAHANAKTGALELCKDILNKRREQYEVQVNAALQSGLCRDKYVSPELKGDKYVSPELKGGREMSSLSAHDSVERDLEGLINAGPWGSEQSNSLQRLVEANPDTVVLAHLLRRVGLAQAKQHPNKGLTQGEWVFLGVAQSMQIEDFSFTHDFATANALVGHKTKCTQVLETARAKHPERVTAALQSGMCEQPHQEQTQAPPPSPSAFNNAPPKPTPTPNPTPVGASHATSVPQENPVAPPRPLLKPLPQVLQLLVDRLDAWDATDAATLESIVATEKTDPLALATLAHTTATTSTLSHPATPAHTSERALFQLAARLNPGDLSIVTDYARSYQRSGRAHLCTQVLQDAVDPARHGAEITSLLEGSFCVSARGGQAGTVVYDVQQLVSLRARGGDDGPLLQYLADLTADVTALSSALHSVSPGDSAIVRDVAAAYTRIGADHLCVAMLDANRGRYGANAFNSDVCASPPLAQGGAVAPLIIVLGRDHAGTRALARTLRASDVFMGHRLTHWGDKVPADEIYEAAQAMAQHVDHTGPLTWNFTAVVDPGTAIDTMVERLVMSYAWDVLSFTTGPRGWKLPQTTLLFPWLIRLFPNAKYLYGDHDVAQTDPAAEPSLPSGQLLSSWAVPGATPHGDQADQQAASWQYHHAILRTANPQHLLTVKYEDFVERQERTVGGMETFLGIRLSRVVMRRQEAVSQPTAGKGGEHMGKTRRAEFGYE